MLFSYYFDFSDIASVDENTAVAPNPDSSGFLRVNDSEKFVPHGFPKNLGFFGEEESAQRPIPIHRDFFAKTIPTTKVLLFLVMIVVQLEEKCRKIDGSIRCVQVVAHCS